MDKKFKIGDEVIYKNCFCICKILTINEKTAIVQAKTGKAFVKRLTSLKFPIKKIQNNKF